MKEDFFYLKVRDFRSRNENSKRSPIPDFYLPRQNRRVVVQCTQAIDEIDS